MPRYFASVAIEFEADDIEEADDVLDLTIDHVNTGSQNVLAFVGDSPEEQDESEAS